MRVNFCILDFKKKVFLCLCLVASLILLLDIGLYYIANHKTTETYFFDNKISKMRHFQLNNTKAKDMVFIGSSRTLHHISTQIFKDNNLSIYNFGIPGNGLWDYPFIVDNMINYKPKKVIINIRASDLFEDIRIANLTTSEMKALYGTDKILALKSLPSFLKNKHIFLRHSESIYYRIKTFYEKFDNKAADAIKTTKIDIKSDCKSIQTKFIERNMTKDGIMIVDKCSNGDSVLFAYAIPRENFGKNLELKTLNYNTIKYLQNFIIDPLLRNDIEVTILLEPIFDGTSLHYDINSIKEAIKGAKVIDLTSFKFSDDELADWEHINNLGRKKYSNYLIELYKSNDL